jgi:hypothetical protein
MKKILCMLLSAALFGVAILSCTPSEPVPDDKPGQHIYQPIVMPEED